MDNPESESAPRPETQVTAEPEPAAPAQPAPSADSAEEPPVGDIGDTFAALLQSALEFLRAVLDWVEERTRGIVKDRIAKPLAVAIIVAAMGACAMATFVALALTMFMGGIVILLAKLVGWGFSALIVGFLITAVVAIILWRMWVAVMPDEQEEA